MHWKENVTIIMFVTASPCAYNVVCVLFITGFLSGVFRTNRLQVIQAQSWDFHCVCAYMKERETASKWLTQDMFVTLQGIGRGLAARLAGHYQCVTPLPWRLLPLRLNTQHTHTHTHADSFLQSLRNAYSSQSIGRSIGDQLAIPCNQYSPRCNAAEVPQWLWHLIKSLIVVRSFLRYPPWKVIESGWTIQLSAALC